jgi:hypothetical protein
MSYRFGILCLSLIILLNACGQPDALIPAAPTAPAAQVAPTPTVVVGQNIANLLRDPPKPGVSVDLDVYNWENIMGASYDWDAERCPMLVGGAIFTDRPIERSLPFPLGSQGNSPLVYPPDSEAWLIPTQLSSVVSYEKYPAPGAAYPPPTRIDLRPEGRPEAYHMRVRGHLGDPLFAHCLKAARIFVVEHVLKIYEADAPNNDLFNSELPAHFNLSFAHLQGQVPRWHAQAGVQV